MSWKILVANDGSDSAFRALSTAIKLARRTAAELHMICVVELPYIPSSVGEVEAEHEEAERRFGKIFDRSKMLGTMQGLTLKCHSATGRAVPTITSFVRTHDIDLLVVGYGGFPAFLNRLVGSTAERLIAQAPCAVVVVK
jgi:nucleotide-binding universal stress UspA family protein